MRIAVTGSEGFIGSHLVRELRSRQGLDIVRMVRPGSTAEPLPGTTIVEFDLRSDDPAGFERLGRPDILVHLAWANVRGGSEHFHDPDHIRSELPAQERFLGTLARAGLRRLVAVGTCQEYGLCYGPIEESTPTAPETPYAIAKSRLHDHLEDLSLETGISLLWARLFYVFGPGQPERSLWGGLQAAIERGDTWFPMSAGSQLRDYLPAATVASLLTRLALDTRTTGVVNLGSGRPRSVRDLVESWIESATSPIAPRVGAIPSPDYESPAFWADTRRLERLLSDAPERVGDDQIPYTRASVTQRDAAAAYRSVLRHIGQRYAEPITEFQREFAAAVGAEFATATSSCTGALHLALAALGIGPGDEVILADTNWVATVAPIVHLGATPVFVDIDAVSWCIDPDRVVEAINPATRAIIATHLYGNVADLDRLQSIAGEHGLALIEDAAEGIGSRLRGRHVGSFGTAGVFSFHGSKTMSTGEGGMLVTNDPVLQARISILSDHGRDPREPRQFWPTLVGFKFKMAPVLAAIGREQLRRVDYLVNERQRILGEYRRLLEDPPLVVMNPIPIDVQHGAWMPTIRFAEETGVTRDALVGSLRASGIDARVVFWPLSSTTPFESLPSRQTPNAAEFAERAVNLPSFSGMTTSQIHRVVRAVQEVSRR